MPASRVPLCALVLAAGLALGGCKENLSPVPGPWTQVVAGDRFTCALDGAGAAWCWGTASFGQLGDNAVIAQSIPVPVAGGITFGSLAAGNNHVCGIATDGAAWCWGHDDFGQLGASAGRCNGNVPVHCSSVPKAVGGGLAFDSIVLAAYATCAIARGGMAWCWGWNDHGQLGIGSAIGGVDTVPTPVSGGQLFRAISLDINHACGVTSGGAAWCWGSNDFGQLAADTLQTPRCGSGVGFYCAISPVAAASGLAVFSVSAGSTHTCALAPGGAAYCWGSNEYGVLGDASAAGGRSPVRVTGGNVFVQVSSGADHTCAVDAASEAWCWGLDTFGQIGGTATSACPAFGSAQMCAMQPTAVPGAPPLVAVSAGSGHTCGLTSDGAIWCWGRGLEGQLGQGNGASSAAPVRVLHP
jgi:alpha-tubulin suppressor-like RCC1 family protein